MKFLRKSLAYSAGKSLQEANRFLKGWKQSRWNKYVMVKNNSFQINTLSQYFHKDSEYKFSLA